MAGTYAKYAGGIGGGGGGGGGNVVGPGSSTTNAIAKYADTTGKLLANSNVLIDSFGNISGPGNIILSSSISGASESAFGNLDATGYQIVAAQANPNAMALQQTGSAFGGFGMLLADQGQVYSSGANGMIYGTVGNGQVNKFIGGVANSNFVAGSTLITGAGDNTGAFVGGNTLSGQLVVGSKGNGFNSSIGIRLGNGVALSSGGGQIGCWIDPGNGPQVADGGDFTVVVAKPVLDASTHNWNNNETFYALAMQNASGHTVARTAQFIGQVESAGTLSNLMFGDNNSPGKNDNYFLNSNSGRRSFHTGNLSTGITTTGVNYTTLSTDATIGCTAGSITISLVNPSSVEDGFEQVIKDLSGTAGASNITINVTGGANIDGSASVTISANYGVVKVIKQGSQYYTL